MGLFRQLLSPQSAFTVRDVQDVACADDPDARLEHIYEWYFARTMSAIRMAFGAAGAIIAAIYGLLDDNPAPDASVSQGLALAAVLLAVAGIFQMRELAQLHREFAVALRLLKQLKKVKPSRRTGEDDPGTAWVAWLAYVMGGLLLLAVIALPIHMWVSGPETALVGVAILVSFALAMHVAAEFRPRRRNNGEDQTLEDDIGGYRLDEYILDPVVTEKVDKAIRNRALSA